MTEKRLQNLSLGRKGFIFILLLPILLALLVLQSLTTFGLDELPAGSTSVTASKIVSSGEVAPGSTVHYTLVATDTYTTFLPIVFTPLEVPTLLSVGEPTSGDGFVTYNSLVSWEDLNDATLTYQLEVSTDSSFSNPTVYDAGTATSLSVNHTATTVYQFYYRVRAIRTSENLYSDWSNTVVGYGPYFDNFNSNTGWPVIDHTWDSSDCFKWFFANGNYNVDICDDRTDVKASPLVRLPSGDYEIEVDARWREPGSWWDAYGILFDAKDDPDPNNPDLGDYYMLWVLWEGEDKVLYKVLEDGPGYQKDLFSWVRLHSDTYNYDNHGTGWNHWKITRTSNSITIHLNGHHLRTVSIPRPTTNNQYLFGVYASTYETHPVKISFDNYLVKGFGASSSSVSYAASNVEEHPYVISGEFDLDAFLPNGGE